MALHHKQINDGPLPPMEADEDVTASISSSSGGQQSHDYSALHSKGHNVPLTPLIVRPTSPHIIMSPASVDETEPQSPHIKEDAPTSHTSDPPKSPLQSLTSLLSIHRISPHTGGEYYPEEIAVHIKRSSEKNGVNPDELPEVWKAPPAPDVDEGDSMTGATGSAVYEGDDAEGNEDDAEGNGDEESGDDDTPMVSRAPNDDTTDDNSPSQDCRTIRGKYGERHKQNPGVVLRYQYEIVQDLTGIDWTINDKGERDGTEYLNENVIPVLEQGIGDLLVREFFGGCSDESGGRRRNLGRRLKNMIVGLDGEPVDFPLGQGECISDYNPLMNFQCHIMEGSVTLFFPPNYSYSTLLSSATLSTLTAIKAGMESDELENLVNKPDTKQIELLFLDASFSLKPLLPGQEGAGSVSEARGFPDADGGRSSTGLIVGMVFLVLILTALICAGLLFYKRKVKEEQAIKEQERARREQQGSSSHLQSKPLQESARSGSRSSRSSRMHDSVHSGSRSTQNRMHEIQEEENGTTTSDDDASTSSHGDGTTTSDDDNGTTTSDEEESTTSGSKETTTDSDQETSSYSSDSEDVYEDDDGFDVEGYGNLYKKKKREKRAKNNVVMTGGDEQSVMTGATGATGFHSMSSQRTVKMKNVVLPNVLDVNLNMR